MNDSIFGIGNIFRFYHNNGHVSKTGRGGLASADKPKADEDVVALSSQGKRLQVFRQISSEVVERLTTSGAHPEIASTDSENTEQEQNIATEDEGNE